MTAEGVVEGGKGDRKQDKSREIDTQKYTEEGGCIGCGKGRAGRRKTRPKEGGRQNEKQGREWWGKGGAEG